MGRGKTALSNLDLGICAYVVDLLSQKTRQISAVCHAGRRQHCSYIRHCVKSV